VTVWGDSAENCAKYLVKGRSVYVEGRLETRSYDKDGQKHYATDIVSERVVFLGGGNKAEGGADEWRDPPKDSRKGSGAKQDPSPPAADDDIPF
jgi:single-strand DNA-binding protein